MRVRITRIDSFEALAGLEPQWWALCERTAEPQVVSTPTWLLAWWRTFGGHDRRIRSYAVYDRDRLIGFAPLLERRVLHRHVLPMRRIELIGTGEAEAEEVCSDYVGVLAERTHEALVGRMIGHALAQDASEWDELHLAQMDGESRVLHEIEHGLAENGVHVRECRRGVCPHVVLPATWPEYLQSLDSRSRYFVTRSWRDFVAWAESEGGYTLRRVQRAEDLPIGREVLHELHETRWRAAGQGGAFARERFRRFHDDVMPRLLARGQLDLLWLEVKGRPLAVLYNILYKDKVSFYQGGRSDQVPKHVRIGIALHCLAMRDCIERGIREYDFLNGTSQYKRQMSGGLVRPLVTMRAPSPSARGRALDAARAATEFAAHRARDVREELRRMRGQGPSTESRDDD